MLLTLRLARAGKLTLGVVPVPTVLVPVDRSRGGKAAYGSGLRGSVCKAALLCFTVAAD